MSSGGVEPVAPLLSASARGRGRFPGDTGGRLAFLAEVSTALLASRDYMATLAHLAELAVPDLGDWCAIDMLSDDGQRFERLAVKHVEPEKIRIAHELWVEYPSRPTDALGLAQVIRSGQTELVPEIPAGLLEQSAVDAKHLRLLQGLGLRSYIIAPLAVKDRVLGAITLVQAESGRSYGEEDVLLAEEFARRAALAVENAHLLDTTREALEASRRAEEATARRARQAAMTAAVALSLTDGGDLRHVLARCCEAAVEHLGAAFARIWTVSDDGTTLELQASAGLYTHIDGGHARVPVGKFKIGLVAAERKAHLTNDVLDDPRVGDRAWAAREGLVAFAGYPLVVEDRLVGVLAMFARSALPPDTLDTLAAVAHTVALGIQRKRAEQAIAESETRYRFLADAIPHHVWTARREGGIDYLNQRALAYFGHDMGALEGHANFVIHEDDVARTTEAWTRAVATGEPFEVEFRLRAKDGSFKWHLSRALPLRDEDGHIVRWFGTNTDISERKTLISALERSNAELDQFAYVTSHDLRAPLRGIANLAQWIEEDLGSHMTEAARGHMRLVRGRVERMDALIQGILDYSRAGRVRDRAQPLDVRRVVDEVIELLSPRSGVRVEVVGPLPTVEAERVPLSQVFMNLLGNALKHAAREDAHVVLDCVDEGPFAHFRIRDNGPGIAPEYHERIWGVFQTLEARDKVEGTGIGLSIVKKIVESRGGRTWVESQLGAGATFHVLWPKVRPSHSATSPSDA